MKENKIKKYKTFISIFFALFVALGLKLEFNRETNFMGYTSRANDMI